MAQTWNELRTSTSRGCLQPTMRRLTDEQANEIRRRYWTERISQRALASEYGVSPKTILNLVHGRTYGDEPRAYTMIQRNIRPTEAMPCRLTSLDRESLVAAPTATAASIPGRTWQHSAAYLADHEEHADWMMTPQPILTAD